MVSHGIRNGVNHYVNSAGSDISTGQFTEVLRIPGHHNRCTLISASVPKTFYLIQSSWNSMIIGSAPFTIPVGNYSISGLASAIQAAGRAATPALVNLVVTPDFVSGKLVFTFDGTTSYGLRIYSERLAMILGFDANTWYFGVTVSSVRNFTATTTSILWILSNIVKSESPTAPGGCLSHFFVNDQQALSYITYQNPCPGETGVPLATTWSPTSTAYDFAASFFIKDDYLLPVNFNGLACDFVIRTWCEPPMYEMLRSYFSARLAMEREKRVLPANDVQNENQTTEM